MTIGQAEARDQIARIGEIVEEVAWHVARVDWLQKEVDAALGQNRRRVFDGAAIARFRLRIAARGVAGHHVNPLDAGRRDIVERAGDAGLELLEPVGQRRQPALAFLPATGRQVEQSLRQPIALQPLGDRLGRMIVGKKKLDRREARFRRRVEAVEEGVLGEHHREVGGEFGHEQTILDEVSPAKR